MWSGCPAFVVYTENKQFTLQSNARYKIISTFPFVYTGCSDLGFSVSISGTPGYKLTDSRDATTSNSGGQFSCGGIAATGAPNSTLEFVGPTGVEIDLSPEYSLQQNYPNPFNQTTSISFSLPTCSFVSLKIYDQIGIEVATIVSEVLPAGEFTKQWNAKNMSSGIYFYCLQAGSYIETKKLFLLK